MALELKLPIRATEYAEIVDALDANLPLNEGKVYASINHQFQQMIKVAKEKQKKILDILMGPDEPKTMKALNAKLKQVNKEVQDFSGYRLSKQIVNKYATATNDLAAQARDVIEPYLISKIQALDPNRIREIILDNATRNRTTKSLLNPSNLTAVYAYILNEGREHMRGRKFSSGNVFKIEMERYRADKAADPKFTSRPINEVLADYVVIDFSNMTPEAWEKLKTDAGFNADISNKQGAKKSKAKVKSKLDNGTLTISITDDIDLIAITQSDAKLREQTIPGYRTNVIDPLNQKMCALLVGYVETCGGKGSLMQKILDRMLQQNPYMFFFGDNANDITGLMGEISGQYLLTRLFEGAGIEKGLARWSGQRVNWEGHKLHRDILLDYMTNEFGIQIKNSTQGLRGQTEVDFADATVDTVLNSIGIQGFDQIAPYINQAAVLNEFNVPYNVSKVVETALKKKDGSPYTRSRKEYIQVAEPKDAMETPNTNPDRKTIYIDAHKKLDDVMIRVQRYLTFAAACLMYLDTVKTAELDANTLILLANEAFVSSAQILESLQKELKSAATATSSYFKVTQYYKKKDGVPKTIVGLLNSKLQSAQRTEIKATMRENLYFKSSFDFTALLPKS